MGGKIENTKPLTTNTKISKYIKIDMAISIF